MAFQVYGYERNLRTCIVRIVAEFEGIPLELVKAIPHENVGMAEYTAKFPLSHGKIPGLETPDLRLTQTIAIVTYLAKRSNKAGLFGDGSNEQEAQVFSWMSWANQDFLETIGSWFVPLISARLLIYGPIIGSATDLAEKHSGFSKPLAPYDYDAVEAGKAKSQRLLETLETFLDGKQWLVGNYLTLADIMVAIYISLGLEWVLDAKWRAAHPHIMKHFRGVSGQEAVQKVIPTFVLIEEETPNVNPFL